MTASTEQPEALRKERIENVIFRMQQEGDIQAAETVEALRARVQELEAAQAQRAPLRDEEIETLRRATFSTDNPFCPCDSKTMRKAVRAAERAHGITGGGV